MTFFEPDWLTVVVATRGLVAVLMAVITVAAACAAVWSRHRERRAQARIVLELLTRRRRFRRR